MIRKVNKCEISTFNILEIERLLLETLYYLAKREDRSSSPDVHEDNAKEVARDLDQTTEYRRFSERTMI